MNDTRISTGDAIRYGVKAVNGNFGFILKITIVYALISMGPVFFRGVQSSFWQMIISGVFIVLSSVAGIGFVKICLDVHDGENASLNDLFVLVHLFVKYFISSILSMLAVLAGLVFLIVPGIIILVRLSFFDFLIVEYESGPVAALRQSFGLTRGHTGELIIFSLALLGLNLAGALCLGFGLLITFPVTMMARTYYYRRLLAEAGVDDDNSG